MPIINQIKDIVNDAVKDALGTNSTLTALDATDIVSLGKAISNFNAYEPFFGSLVNRIARTVYFIRVYDVKDRHILRDEHEYGAFIQKVYYKMPEAVDNKAYDFSGVNGSFVQNSPYDVQATIEVDSLIFGGQGTWSLEIIRPIEQIKTAFTSPSAMASFIDGIYVVIDNAMKLEMERIVALAANTGMAMAINNGKARNLLSEYNNLHPTATLTQEQALESLAFLKYAAMEISRAVDNFKSMSTVFNIAGYETFTSSEKLVVEMLSQFARASDMYLQADTFHDELVKLPNFERVNFWQGSGSNFAFADTSAIKLTHDDMTGETCNQTGIIAFVHDIEYVAAYFGERHTWELFNPRSDVMIHGEKARKGFAVDPHANGIVFYIADNSTTMELSTSAWTANQLIGGKSASDLQSDIVINNTNRTISGTLKHVTGYTQFSGDVSEQSGNYLAVKLESNPDADIYIRLWNNKDWKKLDDDGILIGRISNTDAQKLYVKVVNGGDINYYTYSLTGLTLASA